MNFSDPATSAALIGASGTVLTALIQLRLSWRRELKERERGQPITKKTRRGPVIAVFVLMIAAAVGGFALSQYFQSLREVDGDTLRADLQAKLSEINATATRLEQVRTTERAQIESETHRADAARLGDEGAVASAVVAPCKQECTEQTALRVALCARVPAAASVKEIQLYTRFEDSRQGWADSRVQAGQDAGEARFSEKTFERPDDGGAKQVCQGFVSWNREKSRLARILVKYAL